MNWRFFVACSVLMSEIMMADSVVMAKHKKYTGWVSRECHFAEQLEVMNEQNFYHFNILQMVPGKDGRTVLISHLSAPRQKWGFGRMPIDFLNMKINDIPMHMLQPRSDFFTVWNRKDTAGSTAILNFGGAPIEMDTYMRKNSPVLWFTFRPGAKILTPFKDIRIDFSVIISALKMENGKVKWSGCYGRQALTAVRKFDQQSKSYLLTAEDRYLILQDSIYDGTSLEKGFGPSFITFDMSGVKKGSLNLKNSWMNQIEFELNPDFKEFRVGIWQQKNGLGNEEFRRMFESRKADFLLQ